MGEGTNRQLNVAGSEGLDKGSGVREATSGVKCLLSWKPMKAMKAAVLLMGTLLGFRACLWEDKACTIILTVSSRSRTPKIVGHPKSRT